MKISFLVLTLVSISILYTANAQWQKTFGPFGWTVYHFTAGNGYIYSSGGKVFRSSDNGMTWVEKSQGIWQWDVNAFFFSNNRVFAAMYGGSNDGYLYISDDNGETWLQHNGTGNNNPITSFTKLGNDIYFSTYQNGIFKSSNNGDTWSQVIPGWNPKPTIYSISTVGSTLFFGEYSGLYKSTDYGNSWVFCNNPDNNGQVSSITVKNNTLYLIYGYSNLYKSSDFGNTFQQIASGISNLNSVYSDGNDIYLSTSDGIFRSTDDGNTWIKIGLGGETVHSALKVSNNILIGTRDHGIFTSSNNGVTWINTGVSSFMSTKAIMVINNTIIAGNDAQNGVIISRDMGYSFTEFNNLNLSNVNCLVRRNNDVFAGTTPYIPQRGGIYKSTDLGGSWDFIGLPNKEIHSICFSNTYLFAGSMYDGVFRTSNDGLMWAQVNNGLPSTWIRSLIYFDNKLYAATQVGLYKSTNDGVSWQLDASQNYPVTSLATLNNRLFAGTENGVYILDTNNNWTQTALSGNIYCLKTYNSKLLAGGYNILSFTEDNGSTWTSIRKNNPSQIIYDISFNTDYIFTGNYSDGIWRGLISDIIMEAGEEGVDKPLNFSLYQNYPNPFNPVTTINYQLPKESFVTIKIFDAIGRVIETLVNKEQPAGNYIINWDGNKYVSGLYYYELIAGEFKEVKKMLLLK